VLIPKTTRIRDKEHLSYVRKFPCWVCTVHWLADGRTTLWAPQVSTISHAHHTKLSAEDHGVGLRSCDSKTIPLCPEHHRQLHDEYGDEVEFWVDTLVRRTMARLWEMENKTVRWKG